MCLARVGEPVGQELDQERLEYANCSPKGVNPRPLDTRLQKGFLNQPGGFAHGLRGLKTIEAPKIPGGPGSPRAQGPIQSRLDIHRRFSLLKGPTAIHESGSGVTSKRHGLGRRPCPGELQANLRSCITIKGEHNGVVLLDGGPVQDLNASHSRGKVT